MGFSRPEYYSGLPCPPPEDLPDPGTEPASRVSCIGRWVLYHCTTWEASDQKKKNKEAETAREAHLPYEVRGKY